MKSLDDIEQFLEGCIAELCSPEIYKGYTSTAPLMALGLTSMDLVQLSSQLSDRVAMKLAPTFFFQYQTVRAAVDYLTTQLKGPMDDWLYTQTWVVDPARGQSLLPMNGMWIVISAPENRLSQSLVSLMRKAGQSCFLIASGKNLKEVLAHWLVQNSEQQPLSGILYLSPSLAMGSSGPPEPSQLKAVIKQSIDDFITLCNLLESEAQFSSARLWIVGGSVPEDGGVGGLAQWPLASLIEVANAEHFDRRCCYIAQDPASTSELRAAQLFEELATPSGENHILWKQGRRNVRRWQRMDRSQSDSRPFVAEGAYLIIGNGRLLEQYLAEWYASHGAKELILVDDAREPTDLSHLRQKLSALGSTLSYHQLDFGNLEKLQELIRSMQSTLKGVAHVAGLVDDDILRQMSWERVEGVYHDKIAGAWNLHLATEGLDLDHFLLFGSCLADLAPVGKANLAIGNGFLDALAHYRRATGKAALTIDWGPWDISQVKVERRISPRATRAYSAFEPQEAFDVLSAVVPLAQSQLTAAKIDWSILLPEAMERTRIFEDLSQEMGFSRAPLWEDFTRATDKHSVIRDYLYTLMRRLFGSTTESLEGSQPFEALGFSAIELSLLEQAIDRDLKGAASLGSRFFIDHPNLDAVVDGLCEVLGQEHSAVHEGSSQVQEPIAIIGMACRFPGAANYREYWQNLVDGVDAIREVPEDRWDWHRFYGEPGEIGKISVNKGGFIDDVDKFDPLFFNISPKEAACMDPQHRLFLETAWHAFQDAGYRSSELAGQKVGVYVGVSKNDYAELMREQQQEIYPYISTGTVHSIVSNRVSFILDVHGPSQSVDTACSSALVALHAAAKDLQSRECTMAFVGGVNALLSPTMFLSHSRSGMLAPDGHCKTFDAGANGYVRSEGVGVILLKPLKDALRDGDPIHAVLRGTAINHGGKSTAMTAPNVDAQAAVIQAAVQRADIDPTRVSYIEAHGTGTPLGDPIEIEGLKRAFASVGKLASASPSCVLGSVKPNIGHLESAAGMAGLIKVVLAMKHGIIPRNIHFHALNPKISLEGSPFRIATQQEVWSPADATGKPMSRLAGVSSFGMGGTNAHVILEEAPRSRPTAGDPPSCYVLPISAHKGRLFSGVSDLLAYFEAVRDIDLARLSYTLQFGRDVYEDRLVLIVENVDQAKRLLQRVSASESIEGDGVYTLANHVPSEVLRLAQEFASGGEIEWQTLWKTQQQRLQGLPGYPFKRQRCWFDPKQSPGVEQSLRKITSVHKLPSSSFFFQDHIIKGRPILPGVMYLDLVYREVKRVNPNQRLSGLRNVQWLSPIEPKGDGPEVTVEFGDGELSHFRILEGGQVRCQGLLSFEPLPHGAAQIDVDSVRASCQTELSREEVYVRMHQHGLDQGKGLRVIQRVHVGPKQALSYLVLPDGFKLDEFQIHPAIMDGVFQTVVTHHFCEHHQDPQQYLPFGLESVQFLHPLQKECYAHVEELPESRVGKVLKYRMNLYSKRGDLLVIFNGFMRRPVEAVSPVATAPTRSEEIPDIFYRTQWVHKEIDETERVGSPIIVISGSSELAHAIRRRDPSARVVEVMIASRYEVYHDDAYAINVASPDDYKQFLGSLDQSGCQIAKIICDWQFYDAVPFVYLLQALMMTRKVQDLRLVYLYRNSLSLGDAQHALAGGIARTLIYENPRMELRSVQYTPVSGDALAEMALSELHSRPDAPLLDVKYENGKRSIREVVAAPEVAAGGKLGLRLGPQATVLISGGAGGLGRIFALHLAKASKCRIVLLGRSKMAAPIQDFLAELQALGSQACYLSADVTDLHSLRAAFDTLDPAFKNVSLVIHAAGIKRDSFILKKEAKSLQEVVTVKVAGALNLDALTAAMDLEGMVVFSSIASLIPNQGQADYAAANSFLDSFAQKRNAAVARGERRGFTLSINWPLWAAGGMQVTSEQAAYLEHEFGMKPLPSSTGLLAFDQALGFAQLNAGTDQLIIIDGDRQKIRRAFDGPAAMGQAAPVQQIEEAPSAGESANVAGILRDMIADVRGIPVAEVDTATDFENFGINSIVITELNQRLDKHLPGLPKTLFFEYHTIDELSAYLDQRLPKTLPKVAGAKKPEIVKPAQPASGTVPQAPQFDVSQFLCEQISQVLAMPIAEIDPTVEFERYGINSIIITELNQRLEKRFPKIPKTLFFEYSNINELAKYFQKHQPTVESTELNVKDAVTTSQPVVLQAIQTPLLDERVGEYTFRKTFRSDQAACHGFSHRGRPAVPGACFVEMARQGVASLFPGKTWTVIAENYWPVPLELEDGKAEVLLRLMPDGEQVKFELIADKEGGEVLHASGTLISKVLDGRVEAPQWQLQTASAGQHLNAKNFYETIHRNADLRLAPPFQPVTDFYLFGQESFVELQHPKASAVDPQGYEILPVMFTGVEQALLVHTALTHSQFHPAGIRLMPVSIESIELYKSFPERCRVHIVANLQPSSTSKVQRFDANIFDFDNALVATVRGNVMRILVNKGAKARPQDLAIIGMSARLPQARTLDEFWQNLKSGRNSVIENPLVRPFSAAKSLLADSELTRCRWGAVVDDVNLFDPQFFGISPREASLIDPQERLFLEVAHETFEDAGYSKESLAARGAKVGVFVGALWQDYQLVALEEAIRSKAQGVSSLLYSIPNRVSYFYGLQGPSLAVDTACSSSLTALHLASESLQRNECDMVLVGGVNLNLHPMKYAFLNQYHFLSSEGKCRSYGAGGDGYVPGEGVAAVLLKPLERAIADGDHIYGVIKSTALAHGGKTHGFTVPNPNQQEKLILDAIQRAEINPADICYVEGHGTGTALGDPIEVRALSNAFSKHVDKRSYCPIGSVKSNIGHLEAAAGIVSLIKVLLQMKHKMLVPSLYAETINPSIDFSQTPFYVQTKLEEWITDRPKIAAISSFGAGGSYAHTIVAEYPEPQAHSADQRADTVIVLSAMNPPRLQQMIGRLLAYLDATADVSLSDLAYTLQVGRNELPCRVAFVANSIAAVKDTLRRLAAELRQDSIVSYCQEIPSGGRSREKLQAATLSANALAHAWAHGAHVAWGEPHRRISLPTYPFAREPYWITSSASTNDQATVTKAGAGEVVAQAIAAVLRLGEHTAVPMGREFVDLGLDSILAMELKASLEKSFEGQMHLDPQFYFQYSTPHALLAHIESQLRGVGASGPGAPTENDRWVIELRGTLPTRLRLFCFAPAGGGPSAFASWRALLPQDVSLCLIQLPGREQRYSEKPTSDLVQLVRSIADAIAQRADLPYLMFGHSLGAIVSAEVARRLQSMPVRQPFHLILSGAGPIYTLEGPATQRHSYRQLTDEEFIQAMQKEFDGIPPELMANEEYLQSLIPAFRSDVELLAHTIPLNQALVVDATTIACDQDRQFTPQIIQQWATFIGSKVQHVVLPGTHLSILKDPRPHVEVVNKIISAARTPA